ncbi:MAG: magnesium/cobalt efflux protein [Alphaproteobacteria bacterium]|nr:magnesium/cobalt efflux protein [Alphaproteobacteria bacterium]|tara:strand:- start:6152 stop:7105 length:954 start_codon:yes stop_codon:yes gene_type:complete
MTKPGELTGKERVSVEAADDNADESSLTQNLLTWIRGSSRARNGDELLRESLSELIEESEDEQGTFNREERLMLMNILKLHGLRVDDVMVPRPDIVAIESDAPLDKVVEAMHEAFHSRLPIYQDTLDHVLGFVHIKDLLAYWRGREEFRLSDVAHDVLFVPPTMSVLDLLLRMREGRIHMALVVDEFGGTDGLVTIEDLVEEIVGEIEDEHDQVEAPTIEERSDGTLVADGRADIDEFEARVGVDLLPEERDEDVDTLGGFVFSLVGRVPQRGQLITHPSGLEFEVLDADPRRVKRLRVRGLPPELATDHSSTETPE